MDTITYTQLLAVVIFHWIFDFCLQTDKQAKDKSKCNKALSAHVGIYSIGLVLMAVAVFDDSTLPAREIVWVVANAALHWFTDHITSRQSIRLWAEGKVHNFFVVIGLDQAIHMLTLTGTIIIISNL